MAAWLLRDGEVLAALEVATARHGRWMSLARRPRIEGALLVYGARSVHTLGARFGVDVAYCAADQGLAVADRDPEAVMITVLHATTMAAHRIGRSRAHAQCVIAAEPGAFERWRLRAGNRLEVR